MTDAADEELLARNMRDVHGAEAATLARENARGAALAGQRAQAKCWIRVLGSIQQREASKSMQSSSPDKRPAALSEPTGV
jgi:hypothetical protein